MEKKELSSIRSFTLIELLVIIGILLILTGISFPAFQMAKKRGQAASCLNNVRSIYPTIVMFANSNDGKVKPSFRNMAVLDIGSVYGDYVSDSNIFNCPGRSNDKGRFVAFTDADYEDAVLCQYAIFSPFHYADAYTLGSGGASPSNIRLIGEAIPPSNGYCWLADVTCPWNTSAEYRHNRKMNVGFVDGSAMAEGIIGSPTPSHPGIPPYVKR